MYYNNSEDRERERETQFIKCTPQVSLTLRNC